MDAPFSGWSPGTLFRRQIPSDVGNPFMRLPGRSGVLKRRLSRGGEVQEGARLAGVAGAKVLVIETDESFRKLISERLRLERYRVYEACQETEARNMVLKKDFDAVLLGFTGDRQLALALLRTIKEMRPLVEVILLSSSEDHSLAASIEGMKLGAFDEILVPFDVETLLRRIREACRRKWQRELAAKKALRAQRLND